MDENTFMIGIVTTTLMMPLWIIVRNTAAFYEDFHNRKGDGRINFKLGMAIRIGMILFMVFSSAAFITYSGMALKEKEETALEQAAKEETSVLTDAAPVLKSSQESGRAEDKEESKTASALRSMGIVTIISAAAFTLLTFICLIIAIVKKDPDMKYFSIIIIVNIGFIGMIIFLFS